MEISFVSLVSSSNSRINNKVFAGGIL